MIRGPKSKIEFVWDKNLIIPSPILPQFKKKLRYGLWSLQSGITRLQLAVDVLCKWAKDWQLTIRDGHGSGLSADRVGSGRAGSRVRFKAILAGRVAGQTYFLPHIFMLYFPSFLFLLLSARTAPTSV